MINENIDKNEKKVILKINKLKMRDLLLFLLFISPGMIGFLLLSLYPIGRSFYLSLTNRTLLESGEIFIGFKNYVRAFNDPYVWEAFKNTATSMFFTVIITNLTGLASALLLNAIKGKSSSVFRTLFYLPSIFPAVSMVIMFSWIFDPATGLINQILRSVGVEKVPLWFQGSETALTTLILTSFWAFGGKMVIYLAGRQGISTEYYEAAQLDGASAFKQFISITLPLLSNVLFYNVLMSIIGGLQIFTEAYVLSGTGTGVTINFYVFNLYSHAFNSPYQLGYASALAWLLFAVTTILAAIYFGLNKKLRKDF